MTDIQTLARLRGIGTQYHDFRGQLREVAPGSERAILAAMGFSLEDDAIQPASKRIVGMHWHLRPWWYCSASLPACPLRFQRSCWLLPFHGP
jgi:hypothetical protein